MFFPSRDDCFSLRPGQLHIPSQPLTPRSSQCQNVGQHALPIPTHHQTPRESNHKASGASPPTRPRFPFSPSRDESFCTAVVSLLFPANPRHPTALAARLLIPIPAPFQPTIKLPGSPTTRPVVPPPPRGLVFLFLLHVTSLFAPPWSVSYSLPTPDIQQL